MDMNKVNIVMVRQNLLDIPVWGLADGFSFRFYRPGDMDKWFDIERQADTAGTFDEQKFVSTFNNRLDLLEQRMIFICDGDGRAVATSTAWYENDEAGLVHWVAVVPQMQGQGLAKPLLSKTLSLLAELGHKSVMLRTQFFRIAAINLYLKCGFVPLASSQQDIDCWREVVRKFQAIGLDSSVIDRSLA